MKTHHEVMHVPVLSTGHLSRPELERDAATWDALGGIWSNDHGWVIYVPGKAALLRDWRRADECEDWPGLLAALEWAEKRGFTWLRFDCDEEPMEGLPVLDTSHDECTVEREFSVVWEINVSATGALEAVKAAWAAILGQVTDPEAYPAEFVVEGCAYEASQDGEVVLREKLGGAS